MNEGKPSPMNQYRIDLLEKVGFQWSIVPHSERQKVWYDKYEELKEYKSIHGSCDVPQVRILFRLSDRKSSQFDFKLNVDFFCNKGL
jgi:hypothetical protein